MELKNHQIEVKSVEDLAQRFSADWPLLLKGRATSQQKLQQIQTVCKPYIMPDTSLVVFGSLARKEFTPESDIDWTLLVDGITIPEHLQIARDIEKALAQMDDKEPGRTGTFGNLASSHNIIHYTGGEDGTNANTTRRSLLMLEARAIGEREAFYRVRNNLLRRYLKEDLGLWRETNPIKIPHFLFNDFARYWRMMTVDFADKQHDRFHEGFALRNIKLRISRKLIYISGMLACFRCHLAFTDDDERMQFFRQDNLLGATQLVLASLDQTPLDLVATVLSAFIESAEPIQAFFAAYNHFLAILNDPAKRRRLEMIEPHELATDTVYAEAREVSHRFDEAVRSIFLQPDNPIGKLTIRFGIF